jgi:hypothetical protein
VIVGVVDTGDTFIAGDNATSNKFAGCQVSMDAFGSWIYRLFGLM